MRTLPGIMGVLLVRTICEKEKGENVGLEAFGLIA